MDGLDGIYLRSLVLKEHRQSDAKNRYIGKVLNEGWHFSIPKVWEGRGGRVKADLNNWQKISNSKIHCFPTDRGLYHFLKDWYFINADIGGWNLLLVKNLV